MRYSATVERLRDKIPAPDTVIKVFWPADNGKGYATDRDDERLPYSLEEIESWAKHPNHHAVIVDWAARDV